MTQTMKETMLEVAERYFGPTRVLDAKEIAEWTLREQRAEAADLYWRGFAEIATRTRNCLVGEEINSVEALTQYSARQLLNTPGFGRKALLQIQDLLGAMGLSLLHDAKSATKWQLYVAEQLRAAGWTVTPPDASP